MAAFFAAISCLLARPLIKQQENSVKKLLATVCMAAVVLAFSAQARADEIKLTVRDDKEKPVPFRAELWQGANKIRTTWSDSGSGTLTAKPGKYILQVRHGINYDAVAEEIELAGDTARQIKLKQRFDVRADGWYASENHMHGQHGSSDRPFTFKQSVEKASADGIDFLQIAQQWDPKRVFVPSKELDQWSKEASNGRVFITWNMEAPKNYMSFDDGGKSGNLHCYSHGWTMAMTNNDKGADFFFRRLEPGFTIMQEIQAQGGIVGACHPTRMGFYKGNVVSNTASEIAFDYVAGVPFDAVDIMNDSPKIFFDSEHLWFNLLNMGYKVAGTGNSDGAVGGDGMLGTYRTYARIEGEFSPAKMAQAIKNGKVVASSGAFVLFTVDGKDPGTEFPADGAKHKAVVKAWSAPLPGELLLAVQLIRNGTVVQAWDLREEKARYKEITFDVGGEKVYSWYAVRVLSTSNNREMIPYWGTDLCEEAMANPVYFLPAGFQRPKAAGATVNFTVTADGQPVAAKIVVTDAGKEIDKQDVPATGKLTIKTPATAFFTITADGCKPAQKSVYMDGPFFDYCRNMNGVWPSYYTPEAWDEIRTKLGEVNINVKLEKQ